MRIVIDHDQCQHGGAFADRCLAATIRNPLGHERYCTAKVEDDGQADLTVVLIESGRSHTIVLHDPTESDLAAAGERLAAASARR